MSELSPKSQSNPSKNPQPSPKHPLNSLSQNPPSTPSENPQTPLPPNLTHLGFIVDGNRRWAKQRHLPTLEGHRRGLQKVERAIEFFTPMHLPFLTFYLFSTENWHRSPAEVDYLMNLFRSLSKKLQTTAQKHHLRIKVLGADHPLHPDIQSKLKNLEHLTKHHQNTTICLCLNYGGHQEIADAATRLLHSFLLPPPANSPLPNSAINSTSTDTNSTSTNINSTSTPTNTNTNTTSTPTNTNTNTTNTPTTHSSANSTPLPTITPALFSQYLYHPDVPPLDLIVRTSGEQRLSGFMLWRSAYAEFLFLDKFFPELDTPDFTHILHEFASRSRRFGR